MKKILVTGKKSYLGDRFTDYLSQWPDQYEVIQTSLKNTNWQEEEWRNYDSILNVAGIAHNSSDPKLKNLYYQVNRDLAIAAAQKAKKDGAKQFIHLSSMIVFGSKNEKITKDTPPNPDNFYGDSKLQGEIGLRKLEDDSFKIAIVRPPMVYGPHSKGNFPRLVKLAKSTPIFPDYPNKRSMIYVDNLMAEFKVIIDKELTGFFHPQNEGYTCTSQMVQQIAKLSNHRLATTKSFNPLIKRMTGHGSIGKVFGNLYYDEMSNYREYNISLEESIRRSLIDEE